MKTYVLFRIILFFIFLVFVSTNESSTKHNSISTKIPILIISFLVIICIILILICLYKINSKDSKEELIRKKKKKLFLFQNIIIPVKYNIFEYEKYGNKCTICLDKFGRIKNVCLTPCNHIFHHKCLRKYIFESKYANCPLCKYDLFKCLKTISIDYNCIQIPEKELSLDNEDESENSNYVNDIKIYDNNYSEGIDSNENNCNVKENNSHIKLNVNKKKKKFLFSNENVNYFHTKQISEQMNNSKNETIINERKIVHLTEI